MELKNYQKTVMKNLSSYLECLNRCNNVISGWREYWFRQDINVGLGGVPPYNNIICDVPHVCMKVPTGGGKTFMACTSIKKIFNAMPPNRPKVVIWLVPTDSILKQTIRTLSNPRHPYRQRLDADFGGKVGVYTKEQLLNGQNFSPDTVQELLTVCILSFSSIRINNLTKEIRKVYQENGSLMRFATYYDNMNFMLADTPETALMQVIRQLMPVVVVDESHNATSDLSIEMLNNLNPSFILDLTATPREQSNIISYVDARELKKENMVKLPIIVYNRDSRQSVISDAILLRGQLERQAIAAEQNGGEYIRPIVLFQAQPNIQGREQETYDKIAQTLKNAGIKEEEIGIKTSEVDNISNLDLLNRDCQIRYIITVNALKEGWDCPFAYILASLANKTSVVDVEQIVGRILRQPYAKKHSSSLLNSSYVLTCSNDFRKTLDSVVSGLNKAGFSKKDYRLGQFVEENNQEPEPEPTQNHIDDYIPAPDNPDVPVMEDDFTDIDANEIRDTVSVSVETSTATISTMISQAEEQSETYEKEINNSDNNGFIGGDLGDMLNQNSIQTQYKDSASSTVIPQFFIESDLDLFGDQYSLLEPENLSEGFSLTGQDATISFELSTGEMYNVDLQEEGEAVPKYRKATARDLERIHNYIKQAPEDQKRRVCISNICGLIGQNNRLPAAEIEEYVNRALANMTKDQIDALETSYQAYARRIVTKIEQLEESFREKKFYEWIDSGRIICRESYHFPDIITPPDTINSIPFSLYDAEKNDMNQFERKVVDTIVGLDNIEFWHRIIDRKGFKINAFINHYPDFVVKTKRGNVLLVETKGDYLTNDDSKTKLKLGRTWQGLCQNHNFRYFMVFDRTGIEDTGSYLLEDFIRVLKDL